MKLKKGTKEASVAWSDVEELEAALSHAKARSKSSEEIVDTKAISDEVE